MPFKPGQSGNPSGRAKYVLPDGRTLTDICRAHTQKAVEALVAILDDADASPAAIASAATAILDRGWGKPRQDVGIEITNDTATASMLEQARRRAAEQRALPGVASAVAENAARNPEDTASEAGPGESGGA